jgi:hypothetical protein
MILALHKVKEPFIKSRSDFLPKEGGYSLQGFIVSGSEVVMRRGFPSNLYDII